MGTIQVFMKGIIIMKMTRDFYRNEKDTYIQLEIRLSGKSMTVGLGATGAAFGLSYLIGYLIRRSAYQAEIHRYSSEKKEHIGFIHKPVRSETSD